jgi:hypothetical protein
MNAETEDRKISFRVTKDQEVEGVYCVSCPEMWYVSHTTDPERIMKELVKEWVSFNMGTELPV